MRLNRTLATVAAAGALGALVIGGPASADTNVQNDTTFVGVGSDTSQDVMDGLSNAIKINGQPVLSNYKAQPVGRTVVTRTANAVNCTFTVAKNSGEGRNALTAAMNGGTFAGSPAAAGGATVTSANMTNCVNFARSSDTGAPAVSLGAGTLTYIPFATDSVTYATLNISLVPHVLAQADLKTIYSANGTPGSAQCFGYAPLLPSLGSGTRKFFVQNMLGLTDGALGTTATTVGSCVRDTDATGTPIQEHVGSFLTADNQLIPFSVAQFITQNAGQLINSQLGRAALGSIDWTLGGTGANYSSPIALQTSFGTGTRSLYNVVPTSTINQSFAAPAAQTQARTFQQNVYDTFVGGFDVNGVASATHTSLLCQQTGVLAQYGLAPDAKCGDISIVK